MYSYGRHSGPSGVSAVCITPFPRRCVSVLGVVEFAKAPNITATFKSILVSIASMVHVTLSMYRNAIADF